MVRLAFRLENRKRRSGGCNGGGRVGGILYLSMVLRFFVLALILSGPTPETTPHVLLHTGAGDVELELDLKHAPVTTANFLRYVNGGFYNGGRFYRTVTMSNQPTNPIKIEVIQGGINSDRVKDAFPAISLERTVVTGLLHVNGTISMARSSVDSATSEFFICVGDQPELDFGGKRNNDGQGFAAFGRVTRGLDVVQRIQRSPAEGQRLTPPVQIVSARAE